MASERQDMDPATLRWAASLLEDEARYVGKVMGQHWNQAADELRAQADFIERRREVRRMVAGHG
jgi:hypothetical protein